MPWPAITRGFYTRHGRIWIAGIITSASSFGFATQNLPSVAQIKTPSTEISPLEITPPERAIDLPLTQARYLSNGVYLGSYPGFIAPGHTLMATYFIPYEAKVVVHFKARPYQGQLPSAQLLVNGQLITTLDGLNSEFIEATVPQAFTGKLAEITIHFAHGQLPDGGIKLDTARTPINIPLLHIHALEFTMPDNERRLTTEF